MKIISRILTLFVPTVLTMTQAFAGSTLSSTDISLDKCQSIGHPEAYVKQLCSSLSNGDTIMLKSQGQLDKVNVEIEKKSGPSYFSPINPYATSAKVESPLRLYFNEAKAPKALLYKLRYTTAEGKKGLWLVGLRLDYSQAQNQQVCPVFIYDTLQNGESEKDIKAQAFKRIHSSSFATDSCLRDDPEMIERSLREEAPRSQD